MSNRIKTVKLRLLSGLGSTHPMQISSINRGYNPKQIGRLSPLVAGVPVFDEANHYPIKSLTDG